MKGSTRLDVVSSGGPGMESAIRNSLKKRFKETTSALVRKLGEEWTSTSEGATTGLRSDNIGVTVSVYSRERDTLGYRVNLDTVNANSQKKYSTLQECSDSAVNELSTISRICLELSKKLSTQSVDNQTGPNVTITREEPPTNGDQPADGSADEQ